MFAAKLKVYEIIPTSSLAFVTKLKVITQWRETYQKFTEMFVHDTSIVLLIYEIKENYYKLMF